MTNEQVINEVLLEAQPTKQFVTPEQVAALALFLSGDDATQITGASPITRPVLGEVADRAALKSLVGLFGSKTQIIGAQ